LLIGFAVEFFQIFIASGVVQGASVVTRAVGLVAGYVGLRIAAQLPLAGLLPWMRPAALVGFIPYAVLVIALSGWQAGGWLGIEEGLDRLASINFLPFYYHYFTTEQKAMFSAVTRAILFAPTGLLAWMWVAGRVRGNTSYAGAWAAGVGAAALAFVTETGLLFFRDTRPDPTNIVIAFFAALSVFAIAEAVSHWTRAASQTSGVQRPPIPEPAVAPAEPRPEADAQPAAAAPSPAPVDARPALPKTIRRGIAAVLVAATGVFILEYPLGFLLPLLGIVVYAALLWRFPDYWTVFVLAALPTLDLGRATGRLFFDEFDALVMVTVAVLLVRGYPKSGFPRLRGLPLLVFVGLGASYLVSAAIGLLPWTAPGSDDAFASYYSSYNSLRIARGFLWALVLFPFLSSQFAYDRRALHRFGSGIVLGLFVTALVALWERQLFTGLFNFARDYRVTATFTSVHIGGAHFDAFLAASIPFIAVLVLGGTHRLRVPAALAVLGAALYTLFVTFSRAPMFAFLVAAAVLAIGLPIALRQLGVKVVRPFLIMVGLFIVAGVVGVSVLGATFLSSRVATVDRDYRIRADHWERSLEIRDSDVLTWAFGTGVGSFPRTYYLHADPKKRPTAYAFRNHANGDLLQVFTGTDMYFNQLVDIAPRSRYRARVTTRNTAEKASVAVFLCEKWLITSFDCASGNTALPRSDREWTTSEIVLDTGPVGSERGRLLGPFSTRPVQFAFTVKSSRSDAPIEIREVSLIDDLGNEVLRNGSFAHRMDFWHFETDDYQPWHIDNAWVELIFENGYLGLLAFASITLTAIFVLIRRTLQGDVFSPVLLASIVAFLIVATTGSVFDAPRIVLFFYLILFAALVWNAVIGSWAHR